MANHVCLLALGDASVGWVVCANLELADICLATIGGPITREGVRRAAPDAVRAHLRQRDARVLLLAVGKHRNGVER